MWGDDVGFEVGYISWAVEYKSHARGADEGCGGLKLLCSYFQQPHNGGVDWLRIWDEVLGLLVSEGDSESNMVRSP